MIESLHSLVTTCKTLLLGHSCPCLVQNLRSSNTANRITAFSILEEQLNHRSVGSGKLQQLWFLRTSSGLICIWQHMMSLFASPSFLRDVFLIIARFRFDVFRVKKWKVWRCSPGTDIPLLNVRQLREGWVDWMLAPPRAPAALMLLSQLILQAWQRQIQRHC